MKRSLHSFLLGSLALASCVQGRSSDAREEPEQVAAVEAALTSTLSPNADTTLRLAFAAQNDGRGVNLGVTSASLANLERTVIRFPTPTVPSGEVLYSARLEMTIAGVSAGWLGGAVDIYPMNRTWVEGTGTAIGSHGASWLCSDDQDTWSLFGLPVNNCTTAASWGMQPTDPFPRPFNVPATDRQPIFTGGVGTVEFNVTADVQKFIANPSSNNGWMISGTTNTLGGQWVNFGSRESATPPRLVVVTGPDQCKNDPNKGVPGQCGCGTPDLDTNLDHIADCFDGVASVTADTAIRLVAPTANDGTGLILPATSISIAQFERSLIRIDNSAIGAIAPVGKITKAYLEFTVAGIATGWAGGLLGLFPMNATPVWAEGNGLFGHGASWFCADDVNTTLLGNALNDCFPSDLWYMSPVQQPLFNPFSSTPSATVAITWPGFSSVRFDVTADIQRWIANPSQNNGWLLAGVASNFLSGAFVQFGSRESGAPPRLLVQVSKTCPASGKASPGVCGCGTPDTDTDTDGTPDCIDECPRDAAKTKTGICGCGVSEADADNDKLPNCIDPCPLDADPTLGGRCGCPSSPAPAGTLCEGVCAGSGDPGGADTCDGAGHCGATNNRTTCPAPGTGCTPYVAKGIGVGGTNVAYWVCTGAQPRDTAASNCRSNRPDESLASIQNAAQNAWIRARIASDSWIGANDKTLEGEWHWDFNGGDQGDLFWIGTATGTAKGQYQNWQSGEPNGGAPDDCAAMSFASATGQWQDRGCGTALGYVCQRALEDTDTGNKVVRTQKTCLHNGVRCDDDTVPCINTLPASTQDPNTIRGQLTSCKACTDACPNANSPNPSQTDLDTCRTNCSGTGKPCSDGAAPPPAGGGQTCPDLDAYPVVAPAEQHCKIQQPMNPVVACQTNAQCASDNCGELFHCAKCDPTTQICPTCEGELDSTDTYVRTSGHAHPALCTPDMQPFPNPDDTTTTILVNANACVADKYCGQPVADCFKPDDVTSVCNDYKLCPDTPTQTLPGPPDALTTLETPVPFNSKPGQDVFTDATPPARTQFVADPACSGASCSGPTNNTHPWCHYAVENGQSPQEQHPPSEVKPVKTGSSSLLSFNADPGLNLNYKLDNGPLGLPLPVLSTEAHFVTTADIHILKMSKKISLIEMRANAAGGLHPTAPGIEQICGFKASGRAVILGLDVLPGKAEIRYPAISGGVDPQQTCIDAVASFQKTVDSAHKAFADARELITQYQNNLIATPQKFFSDGSAAALGPSLCDQIAASPPRGFLPPFWFPCKTEPPEVTINRFIYYYNEVITKRVRDEAALLGQKLDNVVGLQTTIPVFKPVNEDEQITIWNTTFLVGPIPCNLEVLLTAQYGIDANVIAQFKIGEAMASLVGNTPLNPAPMFKVGVDGGPSAGAGVSLFAGVGFDIGFASAKLGLDGAIDLGHVRLPVNAWAGFSLGTEPDNRTPTGTSASLVDTATTLIPTKRLAFTLNYGYGAKLSLDNVLGGSLGIRLKLKFFFFSVNYRKSIVSFTGMCPPPPTPTSPPPPSRASWCDITLFASGNKTSHTWGTVELPMPFFALNYLPQPKAAPALTATNVLPVRTENVGKFFFDTLCTCIPQWGSTPATQPKDDCFRKEDCCNFQAGDTQTRCFREPVTNRYECTGCRTTTPSQNCSTDDECCGGGSGGNSSCYVTMGSTNGVGSCRLKANACSLCSKDSDCVTGTVCQGRSIPSGAKFCIYPDHESDCTTPG